MRRAIFPSLFRKKKKQKKKEHFLQEDIPRYKLGAITTINERGKGGGVDENINRESCTQENIYVIIAIKLLSTISTHTYLDVMSSNDNDRNQFVVYFPNIYPNIASFISDFEFDNEFKFNRNKLKFLSFFCISILIRNQASVI